MQRNSVIQGVIIIAAIVGLAGYALAQGPRINQVMMGGGMSGGGMMGNDDGSGYGMGNQRQDDGRPPESFRHPNLSPEDDARLHQVRKKFADDTRQLRNAIQDKQLALKAEMSRSNPDTAKASRLQQELSQLQSEYDQKALVFEIETREISPNGARSQGFAPGNEYRRW